MKNSFKISIAALLIIVITATLYFSYYENYLFSSLVSRCSQLIKTSNPAKLKSFEDFEKIRWFFHTKFNKRIELLEAYENQDYKFSLTNPNNQVLEIQNPDLVAHFGKIQKDIAIQDNDSDKIKSQKIYDYFVSHYKKKYPLYSSPELHNPTRFFSTYASGRCDDTARNLAIMATAYGLDSSVLSLGGHLVCNINYDEDSHIYDPHSLGITKENGKVINYKRFVELGKQNHFKEFNEVIASTKDNIFRKPEPLGATDIDFSFLPNEVKNFMDKLLMINADTPLAENHIITRHFSRRDQFFDYYSDVVANFIREIPLSSLQNNIELSDSFPIVAAFIKIDKGSKFNEKELATSLVEPNIIYKDPNNGQLKAIAAQQYNASHWQRASLLNSGKLKYDYLDLSAGLNNLFFVGPSRKINIANLKTIQAKYPGAKLVTVHLYAKNNLDMQAIPKGLSLSSK
ncbi:MAG: hypothetical protein O3C63_06375 [Cyanobacteria bacterium]|nr:hypothetical protein [Cyanobacteriota bacterium]